jgi:hypothetical protein
MILTATTFAISQVLPNDAVVLERVRVTPNREMILWMQSPRRHPREPVDEMYTCPENSRGHYFTGVTFVSLVDLQKKSVKQTLELISDGAESGFNVLDLPYLIKRTGYYDVPKIDVNGEGKPVLMKLADHNGDGRRHEFALFDAIACMGLETTLVGYSAKRDAVLQYEIELTTSDGTGKTVWVDYLFGHEPDKNGVFKYQVDYRGRAGALEKYLIRYDADKEMFFGTRESIFEDDVPEIRLKEPPSK